MRKLIPSFTVENCKDCCYARGFETYSGDPCECTNPDCIGILDLGDYYDGGIPVECPLEDAK